MAGLSVNECVNLGGADKVVVCQPADGMRAVTHLAGFITELDVGMMVFAMRNPGHGIHEGSGFIIVFKAELGVQFLALRNLPALIDRKFMHLGFHIYDVGFQSPNVEAARPLVYATALLLVLVIVALNLAAVRIRNHLREKYRALEH